MKRQVLGKGIEAIIANKPTAAPPPDTGLMEIDIDAIYPNPYQPRKKFSADKIKELADSIKESGLIQPVVVYKDKNENNKFYLMVGERRWRASQYLNWKKIPAIVKELTHDEVVVGALIENIQREDLNAIEVAEGIELLINEMGLTQERAGERLGMNRTTLTNYLRLLKLPEAIKQSVISGSISQGHARALISLEENSDRLTALSQILKNNLSVRQTEVLVKNFHNRKNNESEKIQKDPDIVKTEEKLAKKFATKVNLHYSKNGSGKIEIFFNQVEEYERIYNILFKEQEQ